jgi:ABC-type cobalt transport system substrate-binding protein
MKNKRLPLILLIVILLLLAPLVFMQFSEEVKWSLMDFVKMGALLLGTALLTELILRKIQKLQYRILVMLLILVLFFLIWAELAVGIFGTPFAGN